MRIAVIGMGSIGRRHAYNLAALGERPLVYDVDMQRCGQWPEMPPWDMVLNLKDIWTWKPEAVIIATPPDYHLDYAHTALEKRIALFAEKPLTNLSDELHNWQGFGEIADGEGLTTMVACNWRFHLGPLALKRWLDEGAIGEVLSARFGVGYYLPDAKPNYKESYAATTGATLDVAWHMADLALWMLGSAKLRSAAVRSAKCIGLEGVDGLASLLLDHDSGALSIVEGNFVQRGYSAGIELVGSKNSADWQYNRQTAVLNMANGEGVSTGTAEDINECYLRELSHFLACVRENRPTCNPVSSAVDVMKILLEAKQCGR